MNWREYDASLRQRGSSTVWFTDEAIEGWRAEPRTTQGGQRWYSSLAILTALTLRAAYRLALRQTERLIGSAIGLLGLDLAVPDHSTLCRRAETLKVSRPRPHRDGESLHLLVDSTGLKHCGAGEAGQGSARIASGIPAEGNGCRRNTALRRAGPGGGCTSAWMPAAAKSLLRRSRPRRSTTVLRSGLLDRAWSPPQIAHRLRFDFPDDDTMRISTTPSTNRCMCKAGARCGTS